MPTPRTSKSLAERININYWRQPHALRRWKWVLAILAALLAAACLLVAALLGEQRIYAAGPLSAAHAMFENDCAKCHTQSWQPARRLATGNPRHRSVPDAACKECHDGPIHQEKQITADVPDCAACHREHHGKTSLARVPNALCVGCHADLKTQSGTTSFEPHVNSFSSSGSRVGGHPEIAVLRKREPDTAVIKLNHAVHLKPEGVLGSDGKPEKLTCASCHLPDSERRYMQPINHERHCSRCHFNALTFDTDRFAAKPVPHREPEIVHAVIRQRYTDFVRQHPGVLGNEPQPEPQRRVPGRPAAQSLGKAQWDWVHEQVRQADRVLFDAAGGCRYCHNVQSDENGWQVTPPKIPSRWLAHSTFRHDSHRMLGCTECHPEAPSSKATSDVLLPGIETCRKCHGQKSGARGDCAECHQYHDKSHERDFNGKFSIDLKELPRGGAGPINPNVNPSIQ